MLKDVALSTGVFDGAVVGVAVGSAGGFTGAEGVVGAGFAGAFLLLTVTLHLYVFLPTLALIYAVPFFFAVGCRSECECQSHWRFCPEGMYGIV